MASKAAVGTDLVCVLSECQSVCPTQSRCHLGCWVGWALEIVLDGDWNPDPSWKRAKTKNTSV